MNIKNNLKIGTYNIFSKKKHSLYLFWCILIISTMVILWGVLLVALSNAHDDILYGASSQCMIIQSTMPGSENECDKVIEKCNGVIKKTSYGEMNVVDKLGKSGKWTFVNIKHIKMKVDGRDYQGVNDRSYDFEKNIFLDENLSVRFKIAISFDDKFFDNNQLMEYKYEHQNTYEDAIICGNNRLMENEIFITDYYLDKFGLERQDFEEVIGKEVTFFCEEKPILGPCRIAGIVDSRIYYDDGLKGVPQIIYRGKIENIKEYYCEDYQNLYSIEDFDKLADIYNELDESGYEVSELGYDNAVKYAVVKKSQLVLKKIISVFALLIMLAILINIIHVLWSDLREKKGYYGMLMANGMLEKDIILINHIEIFILTVVACIISMGTSYLLIMFINKAMSLYYGMTIGIQIKQTLVISFGCAVGVSVMIEICRMPMLCRMCKKTPESLLRMNARK